jgi:hypothetical protein
MPRPSALSPALLAPAAAASLALALLAGCGAAGSAGAPSASAGGSTGAGASAGSTAGASAGASTGASSATPAARRWWKGDFHVHTIHSGDGFDTVAQTLAMARAKGLDFIVLTDHESLSQGQDPDFVQAPDLKVALGCEWTEVAHFGMVGIATLPPPLDSSRPPAEWAAQADDRILRARAEGGAAIVYHPTWASFPNFLVLQDFDAIEIWNSFYTVGDIGLHPTSARRLEERRAQKGFVAAGVAPSPEILDAVRTPGSANDQAIAFWEAHLERGRRVAATGGSDRHRYFLPGYPCTRILAQEPTPAEIAWALRSGRTQVAAGPASPEVSLEADGDGDGVFESAIGDEVPAGRGVTFRARVQGARGGILRFVSRRRVLLERRIDADDFVADLTDATAAGDWWRVDVLLPVDWSLPGASQALTLAQTGAGMNSHQLLGTIASAFGVAIGVAANQPVVDFDEKYLRLLSIDLGDFNHSRAVVTSPIYAR